MLLAPREEALGRRWKKIRETGRRQDPCWGAMDWCFQQDLLPRGVKSGDPVTSLPEDLFAPAEGFSRRAVYRSYKG